MLNQRGIGRVGHSLIIVKYSTLYCIVLGEALTLSRINFFIIKRYEYRKPQITDAKGNA